MIRRLAVSQNLITPMTSTPSCTSSTRKMNSAVSRERRASGDVFIGTGLLANTSEQRSWYEASQLNDRVVLDMDESLLEKLALVPGFERATVPLALFRGVDRPIPTVMSATRRRTISPTRSPRRWRNIGSYSRCNSSRGITIPILWHREKVIPVHPGAMKYY